MIRHTKLDHQFVKHIPEKLEPGVLYVSVEYGTVVHICCCGCGVEVVTPLTPRDWAITFDGESISLWPSVGNWNQPCRSHYIIENNRAIEARPWSQQEIAAEIQRDRAVKRRHYGPINSQIPAESPTVDVRPRQQEVTVSWWSRIKRFFGG